MVRSSKKFTFNRLRKYDGKKIYFEMDNAFHSFIKRLHELQRAKGKVESSIIAELREKFNGADDFSLGVQHALDKLHEKGII